MRGLSKTLKTRDLAYIFFKIRECRDAKERRSWMRRARLALAAIDSLTDAERHEISCIWSRSDCVYIDSPALAKLKGVTREPSPFKARQADYFYCARFDAEGKKIPRKKYAPSAASLLPVGFAANDCYFFPTCAVTAV